MQRLVGCGQSGSGSPVGLGVGGHPYFGVCHGSGSVAGLRFMEEKGF